MRKQNSTRNLDSKWIIPPLGSSQPGFSLAELDSWESRIIWDPLPISTPRNTLVHFCFPTAPVPQTDDENDYREVILAPRNNQFDSGIWLKSIIWDQGTKYREWWKPELNLNDKGMLLEVVSEADQHPGSAFDDKNNNSCSFLPSTLTLFQLLMTKSFCRRPNSETSPSN